MRRWARIVVFPDPDSPRKRMAWFSERWPSRVYALSAMSSAPPWALALASRAPSALGELDEYVLKEMSAWDERRETGSETWKRLARWAVRCVSDCRWAGNEGREGWVWAPPPPSGGRLRAMLAEDAGTWPGHADVNQDSYGPA